ncbi:c-type cytochrome [Devosia sp. CAU 1758]
MAEEKVVKVRQLTRWQRIGFASLLVVGAMVIGGVVFVLSGIYNIGASREHWSFTNFVITILRDRSVSVAASNIDVPDLEDLDLYRLGREHFLGACTSCHGVPGQPLNPIYANMLPQPPDLTGAFEDYGAREVFWIIDHGLKYTGMPAWPGDDRPDEVWSMVAYLKRLNEEGPQDEAAFAETAENARKLDTCGRCHGDAGTEPVSTLVPRLDGLPEAYLVRALEEYRDGLRASGFMAPIAHDMGDDEIADMAAYYAGLTAGGIGGRADPALVARGLEIAAGGISEQDVPACASCHNGSDPQVPPLAGQSARYMETQLKVWRNGDYRSGSAYGRLMAFIAKRLDAQDAEAVSAYYESLAPAEVSP